MKLSSARVKIGLLILATVVVVLAAFVFRSADFINTANQRITADDPAFLPLVIVASLVDSINPCAFSILLLTIAFLFSLGRTRGNILKIGGIYISGLFFVYVLIGLGILQVLNFFGVPHFMSRVGATILIIFGAINIINDIFPKFPIKFGIPKSVHSRIGALMYKASLPTAFILGALVGVFEFPCTGGPYLLVLGLLHDQSTYVKGLAYLLLYNLIFVLPLVLILLIASNPTLLEKVRGWQKEERRAMKLGAGLIMILLGLFIFWF